MVSDLKVLERRIATRYMEDGFWDMYLGLMALAFGLTILLDVSYLTGVMVAVGFALQRTGKSLVTFPRIGYIKLRQARKTGMVSILSGVLILGLMIFMLFMLGDDNPLRAFVIQNMLFFIAFIWGGAVALAALSLNVRRFYFYSLLIFSAVIFSDLVGSLGLNLALAGGLIILAGLVVMLQFIRKYPIVSDQD